MRHPLDEWLKTLKLLKSSNENLWLRRLLSFHRPMHYLLVPVNAAVALEICVFFETTEPFVGQQISRHIWKSDSCSLMMKLSNDGEIPEAAGSKLKTAVGHSFQTFLNLLRTAREGILWASLLQGLPDTSGPDKSERSREQYVFLPPSLMSCMHIHFCIICSSTERKTWTLKKTS